MNVNIDNNVQTNMEILKKLNRTSMISIAIVIFGIILIFFSFGSGDEILSGKVTPIPPATGLASCEIGGTLTFNRLDSYHSTPDAKLVYKNVDSDSRNVIWTLEPSTEQEFDIGPNLLDRLPIPNGERNIFVTIYEQPEHREYKLKAKVGYGVLVNRNVENRLANCKGETKIVMDFL